MPQMRIYAIDSVTSYSAGSANDLFPNASTGDPDADGATVQFGNASYANSQIINVSDNDSNFNDGDTAPFIGQTSSTAGSLFNLGGSIDPEYAYTLTDPATGESFRVYAVTASDVFGFSSVIGFASEQPIDPSVTYEITYDAPPLFGSTADSEPSVSYANLLVCFAKGTQIETANGEQVAVEDLAQGDLVLTADNGLKEIRWIGCQRISADTLSQNPNLRPIRIQPGALGAGLPEQELIVSPQHRMLVRSKIAQKMFDDDEVLVAAKQLVLLDGIDIVDDLEEVTYYHFLFDQHEIVFANGAETESLYTGPEAIKSLSQDAREEVFAIFPELTEVDYEALSARPLVSGRKGRQLAVRHQNNRKPLAARLMN